MSVSVTREVIASPHMGLTGASWQLTGDVTLALMPCLINDTSAPLPLVFLCFIDHRGGPISILFHPSLLLPLFLISPTFVSRSLPLTPSVSPSVPPISLPLSFPLSPLSLTFSLYLPPRFPSISPLFPSTPSLFLSAPSFPLPLAPSYSFPLSSLSFSLPPLSLYLSLPLTLTLYPPSPLYLSLPPIGCAI